MPYVRKGKCVYKKSGKKVGCSKTANKAKKYLKALHVNVADASEDEEDFDKIYYKLLKKYQ